MRLLLAAVFFSACGISRAVIIDSRELARVIDARTGEVLCARTPCRVESERFWPDDPSKRFKLLRAISEGGATQDMTVDTSRIKDGQTIRFDLLPRD